MTPVSFIRWIGIFDAGALAAATAVGQAVPAWQPDIAVVVIALGAISSVTAAVSKLLNPSVPAPTVGGSVSK
jgi:hypothetical protein